MVQRVFVGANRIMVALMVREILGEQSAMFGVESDAVRRWLIAELLHDLLRVFGGDGGAGVV